MKKSTKLFAILAYAHASYTFLLLMVCLALYYEIIYRRIGLLRNAGTNIHHQTVRSTMGWDERIWWDPFAFGTCQTYRTSRQGWSDCCDFYRAGLHLGKGPQGTAGWGDLPMSWGDQGCPWHPSARKTTRFPSGLASSGTNPPPDGRVLQKGKRAACSHLSE